MKNAIYLEYEWFSGEVRLTDTQIIDYAGIIRDFQISAHFCDVGVLNDDGTLPAAGYSQLGRWITLTRRNAPAARIIPVLNYGNRKTNVNFGDAAFNANLNSTIAGLFSRFDIDGIHLDIEGFIDNDHVLLAALHYLKEDSMAGRSLSLASPDFWSAAFITKAAGLADQLNPMIYDTMGWGSSVVDPYTYATYFHDKLKKYTDAIEDLGCELVPILPAYEKKTALDGTVYHDPVIENIRIALAAVNKVVAQGGRLHGAAIFYGPHFMGLNPTKYRYFPIDQEQWKTNWLKL